MFFSLSVVLKVFSHKEKTICWTLLKCWRHGGYIANIKRQPKLVYSSSCVGQLWLANIAKHNLDKEFIQQIYAVQMCEVSASVICDWQIDTFLDYFTTLCTLNRHVFQCWQWMQSQRGKQAITNCFLANDANQTCRVAGHLHAVETLTIDTYKITK